MMNSNRGKSTSNHLVKRNRKTLGEVLFFISIGIFLLVIFQFADISIFKDAHNVNLIRQTRNLYDQNNIIRPKRGIIYDANGQPLAENNDTYSLYLILNKHQKTIKGAPLYVKHKKRVARVLSRYLPISKRRVLEALHPKRTEFQVSLGIPGEDISSSTKSKIEKSRLSGIHFKQQQSRLYPNGMFASHLIGIALPRTLSDGQTTLKGQLGIERSFNKELTGKTGFRRTKQSNLISSKQENRNVKDGDDIYTTLDYRLQSLLEDRMSSIYNKAHPDTMGAVLMNTRTGDILAATQRPSFNATTKVGLNRVWRDVLTQDLYEPGSTMKVFTMAASINSHHYKGKSLYNSGKYYVNGKLVPDWDTNGWGRISYNKGFALSSNVAMAHLERQMGSKVWHRYINRFKLDRPVNIGLDNDVQGFFQFKQPIEQADTAFGQGIEVNTLEMLRGLSAIANNGVMLQPRLISKIVTPQTHKKVKKYRVRSIGHPISGKTARLVRQHMEDVVYKPYGIGHAYKIKGYKIAAKTGTAQISNGKRYSVGNNKYLYSVAGIAPAGHPQFALYLTMRKPKVGDEDTSAEDLAQVFKPVMQQALNENSNWVDNHIEKMPDVKGKTIAQARNILKKFKLKVTVKGHNRTIKEQSVPAYSKIVSGNRVILFSNE